MDHLLNLRTEYNFPTFISSIAGMAKVSDFRGGSSYKDLGLSLGGGLAIRK